jgi:CheY-like chemotaxis protein
LEKPRVLIADDDDATCTLLNALLRGEFVVEIANDGHEAIEKLKSRQYAAILLDLLMPGADGYDVLDFLKSDAPHLLQRVLVVTAALSSRETQRVSTYETCGVIRKPFELDVLQTMVRQCAGAGGGDPFLGRPLIAGGMFLLLADLIVRH